MTETCNTCRYDFSPTFNDDGHMIHVDPCGGPRCDPCHFPDTSQEGIYGALAKIADYTEWAGRGPKASLIKELSSTDTGPLAALLWATSALINAATDNGLTATQAMGAHNREQIAAYALAQTGR